VQKVKYGCKNCEKMSLAYAGSISQKVTPFSPF